MSSSVKDTSMTREELRRRASELVPVLKEREARTEQLRQIPPETVQDLVSSGLIQAVNRLFEASGGRAISESEAIQRFHRDVNAGSHHQGLSWDAAAEDFGRQALGLPPMPGRFG